MKAMPTPLPKLAQPALRALAGARIAELGDLAKFKEAEVKALHGMGPNAMGKLKEAMTQAGIEFAKP